MNTCLNVPIGFANDGTCMTNVSFYFIFFLIIHLFLVQILIYG